MFICEATESDRERWEEFVLAQANTHHAFRWAWRAILSDTFGHRPHYLIAQTSEKDRTIHGVLPLFLVKSILFGRALISVPYLNAGGILSTSPDAHDAIIERASSIAKDCSARYLELRHVNPISQATDLLLRSHKVSMKLSLEADPEKVFARFDKKLRSQIRKPEKDGVSAEHVRDPEKGVADFYEVFTRNMRDLGTPVYPKKLFLNTVRHFGESAKVFVAHYKDRPIASGITITSGTETEIPWASSLREFNNLSANMLVYWRVIAESARSGSAAFDFGRSSPDSGPYRFKAQWGAKPVPLHWYYRVFSGEAPDVNPKDKKFSLLVSAWQKLPLPIANAIGPFLTRSIP